MLPLLKVISQTENRYCAVYIPSVLQAMLSDLPAVTVVSSMMRL